MSTDASNISNSRETAKDEARGIKLTRSRLEAALHISNSCGGLCLDSDSRSARCECDYHYRASSSFLATWKLTMRV